MPYRASFDCLWCGSPHVCRGPDDIEGWASICPACAGKAGDNGFVRFRIRRAIAERGAAARVLAARDLAAREMLAYYEARAGEYDDWYLRRGRYSHGPTDDAEWAAELAKARAWLDGLPIDGTVVELAAGTGWWSPILASKGQLTLIDGAEGPLAIARDRLRAAGHPDVEIVVRDAWAPPDRVADAVFAGFWLSHVPAERLDAFLHLVAAWLRPGGTFAFIDSLPDPSSGALDHPPVRDGVSVRRLADGREFSVVKVYRSPAELEAALAAAGFTDAHAAPSGRFFVLGSSRRG